MEEIIGFLLEIARDFSLLKQNNNLVVERLNALSVEELDSIIDSLPPDPETGRHEKITRIRVEVAEKLKNEENGGISNDTIESLKFHCSYFSFLGGLAHKLRKPVFAIFVPITPYITVC